MFQEIVTQVPIVIVINRDHVILYHYNLYFFLFTFFFIIYTFHFRMIKQERDTTLPLKLLFLPCIFYLKFNPTRISKKMYCIVLIFFSQVAPGKSSSLIGRTQQKDDSILYFKSFVCDSLVNLKIFDENGYLTSLVNFTFFVK